MPDLHAAYGEAKLRKLDRVTFHVKLSRELRFRLWLGLGLIKLGVWVTGARCEIGMLRRRRDG